MLPKTGDPGAAVDLDAVIARLQPIVLDALGRLGLGAVTFQGSADLRWINDRKLGGISAGDFGRVLSVGGFLNIKPPNLDLYLQVVRVPEGKFADKIVSDMREYVCTAEEVAGHAVSYEEFRDALTAAVRAAGIELDATPMTDVERGAREDLAAHRERRSGPTGVLRAISRRALRARPAGGLRQPQGPQAVPRRSRHRPSGRIDAVMMAGDMHVAPPDTLDQVGTALVGAAADDDADLRAIRSCGTRTVSTRRTRPRVSRPTIC